MKDKNLMLEAEVTALLAQKYGADKAVGIHNRFVNTHFSKYYLQAPAHVRHNLSTIGDYQSHQANIFKRYASLYYGVGRNEE